MQPLSLRTFLLFIALSSGVFPALGCKKPHPVEEIGIPSGESIFTVKGDGMKKVVARLSDNKMEVLSWDLSLNTDEGIWWGAERLYGLDDGRLIYCGIAFDPAAVDSCWVIDQDKATRIAEPVLKAQPTLLDSAQRRLSFASNGAWWVTTEGRLDFSQARDVAAETLNLPVPGPIQRAAYSPATNRIAVIFGSDEKCQLAVIERESLALIDSFELSSCFTEYAWNSDGKTIGIVQDNALILWEPLGQTKPLTTRAKGPDGRDEEIRLLGFSPDSTRALVRSSRHHKMAHNPCAGVHNPIYETFVIDIASGKWGRLPQTGERALWVRN
jgi:hypothetical protein